MAGAAARISARVQDIRIRESGILNASLDRIRRPEMVLRRRVRDIASEISASQGYRRNKIQRYSRPYEEGFITNIPRGITMKNTKWYLFDTLKGSHQKLPKERKYVLVLCLSLRKQFPDPIVMGYLRYAAGDKQQPQFITPGANQGKPYAWCDCLPEDIYPEFTKKNK